MKYDPDTLQNVFKVCSTALLNTEVVVDVSRSAYDSSLEFRACYKYTIPEFHLLATPEQVIDKLTETMRDSMKTSQVFQDLTYDLRKTIEDQATKIQQLTTKIEELTPYENYYTIQMSLNHGDKK
jgi:hypothetical protein